MVNKIRLLSAVLVLSTALSTQAEVAINPINPEVPVQEPKSDCISAQDMTEIAQKFTQYKNLAGKEYCFNGSQESYLMAGLSYIKRVQFTNPMVNSPDELFTGKFAKDWFGYFTNLVDTINVESSCPVGVVAYVQPLFGNGTMHVCPMALTNAFTALDLASVFMHEARHFDGFPHITCSQGPRAGLNGACDKKISDGGSYAVTVETYSQLGQYGKDIHPAFRAIAQASALIYGAEAFQTPIKINKEEAFLALTADKKIYQLDSNLAQEPKLVGQVQNLGHFAKSKMGLVIIPEDKNILMTRVFPNGEIQGLTLEYNDLTPQARTNVVDYYFGWTWNARIEKNNVRFFCDKRQQPTKFNDVAISGVEATSVVYPEGYNPDKNFAFVNTSNGVLQIGCESGKGVIKSASLAIDPSIKRIHKANTTTLALNQAGDLVRYAGSAAEGVVQSGLSNVVDFTSYTRATFFDK